MSVPSSTTSTDVRLRIWYSKCGDLRFLGHRDLLRTCERWFRRAELHLQFSQGFHPRALMNFPSALAVGIAGEEELMEVVLVDPPTVAEIETRLRGTACSGLDLLQLELLPLTAAKPRVVAAEYDIRIPSSRGDAARLALRALWDAEEWTVQRDGKQTPLNVRAGVLELGLEEDRLWMRLAVDQSGSVRPREVLQALQLNDLEGHGSVLRRVRVVLASQSTD